MKELRFDPLRRMSSLDDCLVSSCTGVLYVFSTASYDLVMAVV